MIRRKRTTTQARRNWEAVVGRGTPKKTVEVSARFVGEIALVNDARVGQAEKGVPLLPCESALGAPLAAAGSRPLKLNRGREVRPGQVAAPVQGVQSGKEPNVPLAQPRQERLCARAWASDPAPKNAEGRRGEGQASGAQSAREAAEADLGCLPAGQVKGRLRHCESCVAPVEAVVFPTGQAVHCVTLIAPGMPL